MENLVAADITGDKVLQQLVDKNTKQQSQINELSDDLKSAHATDRPAQGMMTTQEKLLIKVINRGWGPVRFFYLHG